MAAEQPTPIGATEYVAPAVQKSAFHCPFCRVYSQQSWMQLRTGGGTGSEVWRSQCGNCREHTLWRASTRGETSLLHPLESPLAPAAHVEMPDEPRADYEEARSILERSPRGAAALLRLALQKLMTALGQKGKNINNDIAALVKDGLSPTVQQALDSLRVTGNHAVHPGQIDLNDSRDMAVALFGLMNYIVEQQITRPKELTRIYQSLPESQLEAIAKRDARSQSKRHEL